MKIFISIVCTLGLLGCCLEATGQTLSRWVIGAAGSNNEQLSYTTGEVAITTGNAANIILTQGFQQPDIPGATNGDLCNLPAVHSINVDTLVDGDYRAANSVDLIGGTLLTGSQVSIAAGTSVRMLPGFTVQSGSDFRAFIEACSGPVLSREEDDPLPEFIPAEELAHPGELELRSFPNPFHNSSTIEYFLPQDGPVLLLVTDLNGRIIERLQDSSEQPAGRHRIILDGSRLEAGMYVLLLRTATARRSEKLVRLR